MIADTLNENKLNDARNTSIRPSNTIPGIMRYPMLYDRLWWVWMYLLEDTLYGNTASSSPENTGFDSVPNPDADIGTDIDTDRDFDVDPAAADDINTPDTEADTEAGTDTDSDTDIDTALKLWKYFYLPDSVPAIPDSPDNLFPDSLFPGSLSEQSESAV